MKKLLVSICLLAIISVPVLAHDDSFGSETNPLSVVSWTGVDYDHQDDTPYKGVATFIFQNNMQVAWTDFHFKISADGGGVYFEEDASIQNMFDFPSLDPYTGGLPEDYTVTFDEYQDISGVMQPTKLNFYFDSDPLQPGEYVQFEVYTDNTTNENSFFTICATPTPEPMTVALLGLGGLVLIRRRR